MDVFELLWVHLKFQNNVIFVGAVYHPPKTNEYKSEELIDRIAGDIEEIMANNLNSLIIVAGDVNQLSNSSLVEKTGLQQTVRQSTRGDAFLDRIYVSIPCYEDVQVFVSTVKSDHKAILASSGGRQVFTREEGRAAKI